MAKAIPQSPVLDHLRA